MVGRLEKFVRETIGVADRPALLEFARELDAAFADLEKRCVRVDSAGHLVDAWNRSDRKPDPRPEAVD